MLRTIQIVFLIWCLVGQTTLILGDNLIHCLSYEPMSIKLEGKIKRHSFQDFNGKETSRYWVLHLLQPVCIRGNNDGINEEEKDITKLQLVLSPEQYRTYQSYVNIDVFVTGKLFHGHSAHHYTPVLLEVGNIKPRSSDLR